MNADRSSAWGHSDPSNEALAALISAWDRGEVPDVDHLWGRFDRRRTVEVLAALVKADLQCRFRRGERPEVVEYLERFPALKEARERVVSLAYEEYYLRERAGQAPDPDSFCRRYEPWRDSLASQLRYHQAISRIVGVPSVATKFPSPGDRFLTFRLRSVLGEGGSARVFLAMDELLGDREVALKVSADHSEEPRIQGRLDHNHIVPVLSVHNDSATGLRGLSMPYRAGLPLDKVIRRIDPGSRPKHALALRKAVEAEASRNPEGEESVGWAGFPSRGTYAEGVAWVVCIIAKALAYAHGERVLHRDVKPANVLLTARDGPQLLDFNLAHSTHSPEQAEEALRGGTLPYMAPEQLEAFCDPDQWGRVGEAADIYSVGLLLREMLTGQRPEGPRHDLPLSWAIRDLLDRRDQGSGSARSLNPDVPHALDAILLQCLAKNPKDRYPSAAKLAEDLRRFVDHRPLRHAANPSRSERAGNWLHRSLPALAIVAVAAVLIGLFGLAAKQSFKPADPPSRASINASLSDHIRRGKQFLDSEDFDQARKEYEQALAINPQFFKAHWGLGIIEFNVKKPEASLKRYGLAYQYFDREGLDPAQEAAFFHSYGGLLLGSQKWIQAREMYQKAIAAYKGPTMHTAYKGLSKAAEELKDYETALKAIDQAILLAHKTGSDANQVRIDTYHIRRAQILLKQAIALHQIALKNDSKKNLPRCEEPLAIALNSLKQSRRSQGKFDLDERWHLEVTHAGVLIEQGDLASLADDYGRSLPLYKEARELLNADLDENRENGKVLALRKVVQERIDGDQKAAIESASR